MIKRSGDRRWFGQEITCERNIHLFRLGFEAHPQLCSLPFRTIQSGKPEAEELESTIREFINEAFTFVPPLSIPEADARTYLSMPTWAYDYTHILKNS